MTGQGNFTGTGDQGMGKKENIAFLGTGLMGAPMVRRLLQGGFQVTVWNRTPDKAEVLQGDGASVAATPANAVEGTDIVITMLSDGTAVADVLFSQDVANSMAPGSVVIDMSSIKPGEARDHAKKLAASGIRHVDAPVSGGTRGAEDGSLAIMAGGNPDVIEALADVFAPLGRVKRVGLSGAGQLSKLANQAIVAINIGGVAEALLLASAGGADPAGVREALKGGFADSTILEQHGKRMLERNFAPGGEILNQIKDLKNILEEAAELGLALPLVSAMHEIFKYVRDDLDGGHLDHSAALLALEAKSPPHKVASGRLGG
jgi:2-hydroxy-3-oxopropionate reductase